MRTHRFASAVAFVIAVGVFAVAPQGARADATSSPGKTTAAATVSGLALSTGPHCLGSVGEGEEEKDSAGQCVARFGR